MNLKKLLKKLIPKFRSPFLTARDLGMQRYTVEEIAEKMKPGPVDESLLPKDFARFMTEFLPPPKKEERT